MTARRASSRLRIEYSAPRRIRELLESLGRTEDIRVSPDGRLLAIAGFERNRLAVLGVDIEASTAAGNVAINRIVGISSPSLKRPHGLDFIDDETLLVVNRAGGACVFELPPADGDVQEYELSPVQLVEVGDSHALDSPGAVWISGEGWPAKEVLICNNFANRVTRHSLDRESHTIVGGEVLLQKWLDIPDGVSVSNDRQWIAISNHSTHNVLLFAYSDSLGQDADPDGILRGLHYPHGVRFSPDDRHIFVADAGAPYVHVDARDGLGWAVFATRSRQSVSWTTRGSGVDTSTLRRAGQGHQHRRRVERPRGDRGMSAAGFLRPDGDSRTRRRRVGCAHL